MAFGAVRSLVVSGASTLLRISGAPRRRSSSSSSKFSTYVISCNSVLETRTSSITCVDCSLGEKRSFGGLGFRFYASLKLSSLGPKKSLAQVRPRRGGAARAGAVKEDTEFEEQVEESKSRNQSKRDAKRARQWGVELASLAPAQLKQAVRWAGLSEEVYDAVMIVKNLGTVSKVRNGRRRQYTYIGGLLRDVDPNVMEPVLKATKDGDVESIMLNSAVLPDPEDLDDKESWAEEEEEDETKLVADEWLQGLVDGVSSVEDEVYSIYDVDFDRQELRKLVRNAQKSTVVAESSAPSDPSEVDRVDLSVSLSANENKSEEKLRQFLINIARQRAEDQTRLNL
ncbi:unnamed protein product [Calypogeia fissa]